MGSPINKLLVDRAQSFSEAEKAVGRANIGAAQSGDYAYTSALSAKQDVSAMSAYLPYSAISADASSAITSINGSSIGSTGGAFTGCSAGNCISGNGTSGSPLGISSTIRIEDGNSAASMAKRGLTVSVDGMRTAWYYAAFASFEKNTATANYYADYAEYSNASGTGRVDYSSIYTWNHPNYYCIIRTPAASTTNVVTTANYPTGLTADARLDIVHLGDTSYSYVVYDRDSSGNTRSLSAGQTGTVWWIATASSWNSF